VVSLSSNKKIGNRYYNKYKEWFEIIEYVNCNNITIKFDNGEIRTNVNGSRIVNGCNILLPSKMNVRHENEKHGERYTKLWKEWNTMLWRCNPKNKRHHVWYSDLGIKVCDEWQKYTNFRDWALSNGFREELTIDRIDENENYCPKNCRWITKSENVSRIDRNKRWIAIDKYNLDNEFIESFKNISSASRKDNVSYAHRRIKDCCEGKIEFYKGFKWKYGNK
jgi:hypothetical protein